jgi:CRP-like cAMP-binding protein
VLGATFINRLAARSSLAPAILLGTVFYCVPTALLVAVHQLAVGVGFEVVRGASTFVVDTLAITALQRSVSREMIARVFGAFFALAYGSLAIGSLLTPFVLTAGLHLTMIIFGAGIPVLCLLGVPTLVRADRAAAASAAAVAPRVAILQRLDLFRNASRSSLEALARSAQQVTVPAGAIVMAEGDHADAFYVLTEGQLDVSAVGEGGAAPVHLRTLGPGSYAGEIGLLARIPRTATVAALTPASLLRIDGADFLDALTSLSASPSLLRSAQARLALSHPSSRVLDPLLHAGDHGGARTA